MAVKRSKCCSLSNFLSKVAEHRGASLSLAACQWLTCDWGRRRPCRSAWRCIVHTENWVLRHCIPLYSRVVRVKISRGLIYVVHQWLNRIAGHAMQNAQRAIELMPSGLRLWKGLTAFVLSKDQRVWDQWLEVCHIVGLDSYQAQLWEAVWKGLAKRDSCLC